LTVSRHSTFINEQLVVGYTTLERAVSKFLKHDYIVTVRFIDGIRSNAIFTLLPFVEHVSIPNVVTIPLGKMSKNIRERIILSYAQPTKESCKTALLSTLFLLEYISKKTKSNAARDIHSKLYKLLINI